MPGRGAQPSLEDRFRAVLRDRIAKGEHLVDAGGGVGLSDRSPVAAGARRWLAENAPLVRRWLEDPRSADALEPTMGALYPLVDEDIGAPGGVVARHLRTLRELETLVDKGLIALTEPRQAPQPAPRSAQRAPRRPKAPASGSTRRRGGRLSGLLDPGRIANGTIAGIIAGTVVLILGFAFGLR